jgi:DNA-binding SARP family transcriptional activator
MLARLGVPQASVQNNMPLNQASRLRSQSKFAEAETLLKSLLLKNPANMDAALMLMRLYAQDLGRADKAREILRAIEKQPYVSQAHIEYAHRSIDEWSQPKPEPEPVVIETKSVDELIEHRRFGTAIEMLEQKVREQPADFDSWLKIIEVHGRYCGNIKRAEKIVEQIEADPAFSPEQISLAKTKLAVWRQTHQAKF